MNERVYEDKLVSHVFQSQIGELEQLIQLWTKVSVGVVWKRVSRIVVKQV